MRPLLLMGMKQNNTAYLKTVEDIRKKDTIYLTDLLYN
jgi:hypothetical protein